MELTEKTWSYINLTAQAEEAIRSSVLIAQQYPKKSFKYRNHTAIAWGVYWGWYATTRGWQRMGDAERLEKLLRAGGMRASQKAIVRRRCDLGNRCNSGGAWLVGQTAGVRRLK